MTFPNRRLRRKISVIKLYGTDCYWCKEPIDMSLEIPDPGSFTLDHYKPKSEGGTDSIKNLRPMHYSCNQEKGGKIIPKVKKLTYDQALILYYELKKSQGGI